MGLDVYREFMVFAQHLNITRAAEKLHVSPSTLSRHISALEAEMGTPLFTHTTLGCQLTRAGDIVLRGASTLVADYRAMRERVDSLVREAEQTVSIAYALDDRTMIDCISLAKANFVASNGKLNVRASHTRGQDNWELLISGDADVIVDYNLDEGAVDERFGITALMEDSIVLALPRGTYDDARPVDVREVCGRFVPRPTASADNYFERALRLFDGCGRIPNMRLIDASTMDEFFMHRLEADEMWLFSRRQLENYAGNIPRSYRESCEFHNLTGCDTSFRRWAVWRRDNPRPRVETFVRCLADAAAQL